MPALSLLDKFPAARRANLLRRYAVKWGYGPDQVEQVIQASVDQQCQLDDRALPDVTAILADDGRYHLATYNKPACAGTKVRRSQRSYRHTMTCRWWMLNGVRRFGNSMPMNAESFECHAVWVVELGTDRMLAGSVAPHLRCPLPVSLMWPRYLGGDTSVSRIRARLVAAFGETCAICGRAAQYVDHDHDSGLVRGMLCEFCNVSVEWCPHLSGCAFADYLASPPALSLAIRYPNRGRRRPTPLLQPRTSRGQ